MTSEPPTPRPPSVPSGDDGCLKAFAVSLGVLVSLFVLGWGLVEVFAGSWTSGRGSSSATGVVLVLSLIAVPVFAVWLFISLIQVTRNRRQAVQAARETEALRKAEAPAAGDDAPPPRN